MIIEEPKKIKLELMDYEIENIIQELQSSSHNIYEFMNFEGIIKKMRTAMEKKENKK